MTVLVAGASGATGRLLVDQLLNLGHYVRVIVRSPDALPESMVRHDRISVIKASLLHLSDTELAAHAEGCNAVASCLGHNPSLKGIYGHPRGLVTDAARRLYGAIKVHNPKDPVKFVLMNTAGNRDLNEPVSFAQKCILALLRMLLPPHADNEKAGLFFRTEIGKSDEKMEWVVVRPDDLIDNHEVTGYEVRPAPIRSAIFNPGKTSRINVAHFMATLIIDNQTWNRWKGQMPVIYNKAN
ncbi:MAG: NAD(P)H-binding protein [Cytophagales bacterium]|nr:NAD(P)H-binding protein [Cytophagales bacterium]